MCRVAVRLAPLLVISPMLLATPAGLLAEPAADRSAAPVSSAEIDALEGADKLFALIDGVVARQRGLRALRAEFTLVKHSSLLLDPATSYGTFTFLAPDRVRWDYEQPELMVVLFAKNVMTTFHPEQARAEKVKLARRHRRFVRVLAGTQPLDDLASQFRITLSDPGAPVAYRLTLEPTHTLIRKKLSRVILEVDRDLLLPVVVEYHEVDGDSTRYEFRRMEIDPELAETHFSLDFGSDVHVDTIDASSGIG